MSSIKIWYKNKSRNQKKPKNKNLLSFVGIFFNKFGIYVLLKASKAENKKYKDKLINIIKKNKNEINNIINTNTKEYNKILKIIHNNKDLNELFLISYYILLY